MSASAGGRGKAQPNRTFGGTSARSELSDSTVNVRPAPDPLAPGHSLVDPLAALPAGTATAAVTSSAMYLRPATCGRRARSHSRQGALLFGGSLGLHLRCTRLDDPYDGCRGMWTKFELELVHRARQGT